MRDQKGFMLAALMLLLLLAQPAWTATYYVDSAAGSNTKRSSIGKNPDPFCANTPLVGTTRSLAASKTLSNSRSAAQAFQPGTAGS